MSLQSKLAVEDLPEEILLSVFKHLDPNQIPDSRRICSKWLKVIDENKSLWRVVEDIDNLELFDYKSESSLTEVSFTFYERRRREYEVETDYSYRLSNELLNQLFKPDENDAEHLYETLLKSSDTLRVVNIVCLHPKEIIFREMRGLECEDDHITRFWNLSELVWQLPKLEDFRLTGEIDDGFKDVRDRLEDYPNPGVELVKTSKPESNVQEETSSHSSRLKVLWIDYSDDLFALHVGDWIPSPVREDGGSFARRGLLNNLTSLSTWDQSFYKADYWQEILKVPSKSLKHLRIGFARGEDQVQVPVLNFPKLEVFEFLGQSKYPNWIIIPETTILVILSTKLPSGLPNVSELWSRANEVDNLSNTCPSLETLKIGACFREPEEYGIRNADLDYILGMVKDRIEKEAAGIEVDGVRMKSIKSLALPFERAGETQEGEEVFVELKKLVQLSNNEGDLGKIKVVI